MLTPPPLRRHAWFALVTLALSLTACGEDPSPSPQTTPAPPLDMTQDADMTQPPEMDTPDVPEDMAPMTPGAQVRPIALTMMPPVPTSCDTPSRRYRLPFVLTTDLGRGAREGDRIGALTLTANKTVTAGSIAPERVRLAQGATTACVDDSACAPGFRCTSAGSRVAQRACARETGVSFIPGTVQMDFDPGVDPSKRQLVTVLMENSGGLTGLIPTEDGSLYVNGERSLSAVAARATDPTLAHRQIVRDQLLTFLASVVDPALTRVSLWWFAGDNSIQGVRPLTEPMRSNDHFTSDLSAPVAAMAELPMPNARSVGNVYQAILRVVSQDLGLAKYNDHEKFLVLLVDGPNELWDSSATAQAALAALEANNIHTFIIHLDPQVDTTTVRDLQHGWAGSPACRADQSCASAPPCSADSDCDSTESCRPANLYPNTPAGEVTQTSTSYCMPRYEDGRRGPSARYANIACRTGGSYLYMPTVDAMRPMMRVLPSAFDGQWSIEADLSALDVARGVAAGFYQLSGYFSGVFGNNNLADVLSAPRDDTSLPANTNLDNRHVIRLGAGR